MMVNFRTDRKKIQKSRAHNGIWQLDYRETVDQDMASVIDRGYAQAGF